MMTLLRTVALAMAALTMLVAAPARAEWLKAETAHFVVYGDVPERDLRAYAVKAERFDALLRAYYPITVDHEIPKLDIFLANGRRDMLRASPGLGSGVGGYYSPNSGRIHAVVDLQAMGGDVVLFHEYAHHFMFQMRSNAYPSWFVEGFAEYYSTAEIRPDRIRFGRHHPGRMLSLTQGANTWARMEDVLTWKFTASGRYPAHSYYAQAWAMTHFFMSTPERTRMLGRYLNLVVAGQDSIAAMREATGLTPDALQSQIRNYLTGSINVLTPALDISEPAVTITRLSPSESALAWMNLRLDRTQVVETAEERAPPPDETPAQRALREEGEREEAEYRQALITEATATAARFPGDRMATIVTAKAQRLALNPAAALETLQPLLPDSSTDAEALRVAALALMDQLPGGDGDAALRLRRRASGYFARAMDSTPLDFRVYLGLNDVRQGQARYPNDNDLSTLQTAVALAPQSFDARMRLGHAYMNRDLQAAAIDVLSPVANSPHRNSMTRRAQAMIASMRSEPAPTDQGPPDDEAAERPASGASSEE